MLPVRAKHVRPKSWGPGLWRLAAEAPGTKSAVAAYWILMVRANGQKTMRVSLIVLIVAAIFYGIDASVYDGHYFAQLLRMLRDMGLPV